MEYIITMNMRQQMVTTLEELMATDERLVVLLADISYSQFNKDNPLFSERILNLGILEQTMVGTAAGVAMEGFIPAVHSFASFLVERPFEQLKDDFCYQQLGGNFISNGASYDYSVEGMTHHGPGDVQILRSLPGMQIVVPGTPREFDALFHASYANGSPTYYRLTVKSNPVEYPVRFGELVVVKQGKQATVIAVGPMLAAVLPAVEDMDVTVLYCTTVAPFDGDTLRATIQSSNIITVEPYYEGVLVPDICSAMKHTPIRIETIGVPHKVLSHYGNPEQHDEVLGLTPRGIRSRIERFLNN
jgi:transketolase